MRRSSFAALAVAALVLTAFLMSCSSGKGKKASADAVEEAPVPPIGFRVEDYICEKTELKNGEAFGSLMSRLGLGVSKSYELAAAADSVFDVRKMRAGNKVDAYYSGDSLSKVLEYAVYANDRIRSTVFKCKDSLAVWTYDKPVTIERKATDVTIKSSLWNDMTAAGASPELILELADIYAWTVDFFGLQPGDRFRAIYDQRVCEGEVIDISKVDLAIYDRGSFEAPAIRFDQGDGGNKYWNEKGGSMRKAFLKAPLKFTRISSGFSYARRHPVTGKVRPHTAVDYAAPAGTPVHALGDGTILSAGWAGGGGNTVKIRHNSVYTTGYLHLSRFAKGIKAGVRVHQGDVIGYVGSTGVSTGPHLDFRVWKNGTPVNPLKLESPSAEPIKAENKAALDSLYKVYRAELEK